MNSSDKFGLLTGTMVACWFYIKVTYGVWDDVLLGGTAISALIGWYFVHKEWKVRK